MGEYFSRPQSDRLHCHPAALVRIQSRASSLTAKGAGECYIIFLSRKRKWGFESMCPATHLASQAGFLSLDTHTSDKFAGR